jgi:hypothetical protein
MFELFVLFAAIAFIVWILVTSTDKDRIKSHISKQGNKIISITLRPFGKGWAGEGEGGNRIYEVIYIDKFGNKRHVWCKTSPFSGVYTTDDEIIEQAKIDGRPMTDEEKIALLEDEIKKLKDNTPKAV